MENVLTAWIWIPIIVAASLVGSLLLTDFGKKLKDKKLGIIGLAGSGKTTLAEYLANDSIPLPEEIKQTVFEKNYDGKTFGDLGIKIAVTDSKSNSTKYDYSQEKELLLNCDIILYLFDMSKLFIATEKDGYFKRISKEIRVYQQELKQTESKEKIFIALGTHADKIDDLGLTQNEFDSQFATIRENLKKLFENNFDCDWHILFFNSLVDNEQAEKMVNKIFEKLRDFFK